MEIKSILKRYEVSGKAPTLNLGFIFIIGIFIMFLLGLLYSCLTTFIPIPYFNVFVLLGFSYAIAHIGYFLSHTFKIRNKVVSMVITTILALFATYFQWVFYIYIISSDNITPYNDLSYIIELLLDISYLIDIIFELNSVGVWEFDSVTYTGTSLWLIWLGEVLLTLIFSLKMCNKFELKPFSEKDNQWFYKAKIHTDFEYIHLKRTFLEGFYNNPVEALTSLEKGNGIRQSTVYIFSSKSQDTFLISIENSIVNNKGRKESTEVLEPCFLNRSQLIGIKEKFTIT
mgnify:CR=1 FL=1